LAHLVDGAVEFVSTRALFAKRKSIVVGVPGAFTPVCTRQHVPDFIRNADKFRASGYDHLVCVAANDPFVVAAWAATIDPKGKLSYFADGNLKLARALGLLCREEALGLGERSQRYLMMVDDGVITRLRVEPSILVFTCTGSEEALVSDDA